MQTAQILAMCMSFQKVYGFDFFVTIYSKLQETVKLIEIIERVQRRATKYILSLPYRTEISYKDSPNSYLCYWHEYLDLVYTYKSVVNNTDTQFKISKPVRVTRRFASSKSVLLDIPEAKTVTFQNSFYSRASTSRILEGQYPIY